MSAPEVRLTILGDNAVARPGVSATWGFSCLVEAHGHTVLFDTGADAGVLRRNLAALNLVPARIESVIISHHHADHTRGAPGLGTLPGGRVFIPRLFEEHSKEVVALQSAGLTVMPISRATPLFDGMVISEPLHFETSLPSTKPTEEYTDEGWEQSLIVDTPKGLVVIVGCSHPGILAMLKQVKRQTDRPLHLVIGGFHLLGQTEPQVRQLATAMRSMGVAHVSAAHCSGEVAVHSFRDIFGDPYVSAGVGAVIECPLAGMDKSFFIGGTELFAAITGDLHRL
jgi:7,8-dihydropterin-6-yl-methyl-4-(beta-D-ribofuranosyl)aminobenzene 5'-phosphate synthase